MIRSLKDFKKQNGATRNSAGRRKHFRFGFEFAVVESITRRTWRKSERRNLSGSATVRIIKPPTEGGESAAPKLEKTPTLTNEGVIRLVEAGFSEGTIIKRIEDSPVDFDLSPGQA